MNNYEYCATYAANLAKPGVRVLDYGCGGGRIVDLMIERNVDAWGCDVFYKGGDLSSEIPLAVKDRILPMEGDRLTFDDNSFDVVTTNMVLEHVENIDTGSLKSPAS